MWTQHEQRESMWTLQEHARLLEQIPAMPAVSGHCRWCPSALGVTVMEGNSLHGSEI